MRSTLIIFSYRISQPIYRRLYKHRPAWQVDLSNATQYPEHSLGQVLADFLKQNNYELMKQFEDHDVSHVLTQIPTSIMGEIEMQYYLFGNGKRSPYLWLVILTGLLLYPLHCKRFWRACQQGQQAHPFYREDFLRLLHCPISELRRCFNIQPPNP